MRKLKRMIALVTVALFVLSFAAPVGATTKEEAFGRLKALGVAVGNETGDPMYDKTFTRAEAAAIMVNLSGMKAAIEAAKGPTKFKDVPGSHWASGVINLAVGAGIIKGYPDGTYKPEKEVSYAELSAMLVGVLGYTPKLQGTWPSNVIGKAAQLGLLDGLTVNDFNAAALRSNVFLAADNALDVKPLKETKDGYEEDTKTLVEAKLNVTVKDEGTVTATPAYSSSLDKNKVKITYAAGHSPADETLTTVDYINPDDYYGLKVKAWIKDDKVFFLDVKTDASDILVDTLEELRDVNGGVLAINPNVISNTTFNQVYSIKLDASDKVITVVPGVTEYKKNFADLNVTNTISNGGAVKVILGSDGKAARVLSTGYKNGIVDSIDTTNEKITMDSETVWPGSTSTIELKDKKVKIYRNGVVAKLSDLKKGDVLDYIDSGDVKVVYANDKTETGKLTAVYDDGVFKDKTWNKFKFKVGDKELKSAEFVFISTNNGDSFTRKGGDTSTLTSDFTSVLNKDVTVKLDKGGKAAYIIAGSATDDTDVPVTVKYIKKVSTTETKRYIYVAKFDGTETYYEVTKDTKIDGIKISEDALKQLNTYAGTDGPQVLTTSPAKQIVVGSVVKLNLGSDGTINEIKTYDSDLETGTSFTVSKDNDTFMVTGGTNLIVDSNTKIIRVKGTVSNVAYDNMAVEIGNPVYDDLESITWASVETLSGGAQSYAAAVVKDGGKAKYILLKDPTTPVTASDYFGVVVNLGTNVNGDSFLTLGYDGKVEDRVGSITNAAKKKVVKFTLKPDGKIDTGSVLVADAVYTGYTNYKVDEISDRQLKLKVVDGTYTEVVGAPVQYIIIDLNKTKVWDVDADTSVPAAITINDVLGKYVQVYDEWDADGNAVIDANGDGDYNDVGDIAPDGVYDFIMLVKK